MGHVQDLWHKPGENGRKVRSDRYGKGNRWQARWDEHGRERAKAFPTRDAAEGHLAHIAVHGPAKPRPRVTFGDYAATWRGSQLHHRPSTATAAKTTFQTMLQPELGQLPLVDVTRQDVQNAVITWTGKGYSPARIHIAYGYVATVYKSAVLDGLLAATPCQKISLPEKVRKRIQPLSAAQVHAIAAAVPAWWRPAVILGAATGLRIGELGGLTCDRIRDGVVTVDRQLVGFTAGQPRFGPPKSKAGFRDVRMGAVAQAVVERHIEERGDLPHDLVFTGREKGPLSRTAASNAWRSASQGMKLRPRSGWHDLRHFHASALIAAGLSPRAVADRLGHADVAETLRTYSHLWPNDESRSVLAIDEVLSDI